jgi:hypothetical protein
MKKLRNIIIYTLITSFIFSINAFAIDKIIPISIKINDDFIIMDTEPTIINNEVYVPLRFVANALNAEVIWDGTTRKITIKDNERIIEFLLDSTVVTINEEQHEIESILPVINNRTMVPIKFVAEHMNCQVNYNKQTYTVEIIREGLTVPTMSVYDRGYTDEDLHLLAKIVTVEAHNIGFDAKVAVANVVLNRKKSSKFPNTVEGVIFDKKYCVQFPPAHKSSFNKKVPSNDSIIAAKMALEGANNISDCLFFNHSPFRSKAKDFYKKIDGEYFYH